MYASRAEVQRGSQYTAALEMPTRRQSINVQPTSYVPVKVAIEWVVALLFLIPVAIVLAVLGTAVAMTSPGGAFYRQKRVGRNGKEFYMIKLRSMVANCEATSGAVWSKPGDPRVTPIGRLLRDTHLDELPQLLNVLRGEMSIIGPRPERPEIIPQLAATIPNYLDRLAIRPGLTGLAQVQLPPDVSETDVRRKLAYDRFYIEHATLMLDLRIVVSTCLFMFSSALEALRFAVVRPYGRRVEAVFATSGFLEKAS
jgi:lipopolysaccharide/colanic/teichoic acid biosynthesis glycosyltransferase